MSCGTIVIIMSNSWAQKRRIYYLSGIAGVFLLIIVPFIIAWLYEPPTCFDGKLNQGESAIDKGGPCELLDETRLIPETIQWARTFKVRDGVFNAISYIENANRNAGVKRAPYTIKLYDSKNILVAERFGTVTLRPGSITPIFEGGIHTGNRVPVRAFFEFTDDLIWVTMEKPESQIDIYNEKFEKTKVGPRITATIKNLDVVPLRNIALVVVIFDKNGNAFASSRTIVEGVRAGDMTQVTFTWPTSFDKIPARIDILPILDPLRE